MIKAPVSLQDLRRRLYIKAKAEPSWRFWGLYVHVCKRETLKAAYQLAKSNGGAPGIDGVTFEAIEAEGAEGFLEQLRKELEQGSYRPQGARKVEIPKEGGKARQLSIPTIRDRVVQGALKLVLEPIFEADFQPGSFGYRPKKTAHAALRRVAEAIVEGKTYVIDLDLRSYLDASSYYTPSEGCESKRPGTVAGTLILKPLRRPWCTWTAWSSPRFTRCNTVCRETPRMRVASSIGMYPSGAFSTKRERSSSLMRMRQGAPGVSCSAAIKPSFNQRWTVEGATPRISAALCILTSSPSGEVDDSAGSKRGIPQCVRRLQTRLVVKRIPVAVRRPCRLKMPAMTASA